MNLLRRLARVGVVSLAVLSLSLPALFAAIEDNFEEKQSRHFIVRYDPDISGMLIDSFLKRCEKIYEDHRRTLGNPEEPYFGDIPAEKKLVINYYGDQKQYIEAHPQMAYDFRNGLFNGAVGVYFGHPMGIDGMLSHEIGHAVIFDAAGTKSSEIPAWLHEGFAVFLEKGGGAVLEGIVRQAVLLHELVPLEQLGDGWAQYKIPNLVYAEGGEFVQYLEKKFGSAAIGEFIRRIGQGSSPDEAVRAAFSGEESFGDLCRSWERHVVKRITSNDID